MKRKLSPYEKIVNAGKDYRPLRLSRDEVAQMSTDTAIIQAAENDAEERFMDQETKRVEGLNAMKELRK